MLPPQVTIEHVVEELAPPLASGAVVEEPAVGAVHRAVIAPCKFQGVGEFRDSLVAPPPARVRFRLNIPPDARLHFGVAVEGGNRRTPELSGVEFRVTVDGRVAFDDVVNPAVTRKDRHWIDSGIDLRPWANRAVDVVLETRATDPARALAGTAAWSRVRLLREERQERQRAGAGPNLLVLLVDTLRADSLGIYGVTPSPSPNLDRFAARGLVFDPAVSQASWTMPAVASIFTGLYPRSHGAVGPDIDHGDYAWSGTMLPNEVVTFAELAQQAGITTFGASASLVVGRGTNFSQGFETFVELPGVEKPHNQAPASAVNREFLDWLRRARGLRFLAYLHYMEPHGPYAPPAELRPPPPPGIRGILARGVIYDVAPAVNARRMPPPSPAEVEYLHRLYTGDVQSWDRELGTLLQQLDTLGLLDDTVVVVTADHGEEFLEHGNLAHGDHLYEETLRVPLVIVGPGVPSGRRQDLAQGIDLLPTLAGLLKLSVPPALPGRDLLATQTAGDAIAEIVTDFGNNGAGRGIVALRTERWKLIRSAAGDSVELYDLANDPSERTNVAALHPEAAALATRLDRWVAAAAPPPPARAGDAALRDKLRQLGYVR